MPSKNLVTANVVVAANTFNVSIFNQLWLLKNGIFSEAELNSSQSIFLPVVTQIETGDCQLLIMPERVQLTLKSAQENTSPLDKVCKIVKLLPETPYAALGLNIIWALNMVGQEEIGEFTHRNFAVPDHALYDHFLCRDARFGTYMSKIFSDFRLKLDIKPVINLSVKPPVEMVQLNFNFNVDLGSFEDKAKVITDNIMKWSEAFNEAEAVVQIFV